MSTTAIRTCPLCEATCGLAITIEDGRVTKIRGDEDDVFSKGFVCPKGASLRELHEDPDRLRGPVRRSADGSFEPVSWDEAFAEIAERFAPVDADARAPGVRRLHRQPVGTLDRLAALRPRAAEGARHAQHLHAPARSTRCPSRPPRR